MRAWFASVVVFCLAVCSASADFDLTLLHTNDLHSHAEPVTIRGKSYGGYARQATLIQKYRKEDKNTLLLNGGDVFQGTLYFNVYEGLSDLAFMNQVGYDAMSVGNHEFDKGPAVFADFVRRSKFPVLAANLDLSAEPLLRDQIKPHTILTVGKEKIGIIGAVTPDLPTISDIGQNIKMKELMASIRESVKALEAQKVNKILVVSHCGYELERKMATEIEGVDVVVGGHSHSYLANPDFQAPEGFPRPWGAYPTIVNGPSGKTSLVVQAWEWGKILGRIKIKFDNKGFIKSWRDARPIVIDETTPEDPVVANLLAAFQKPIASVMKQKVGVTEVPLERSGVLREVIADSMLEATAKAGAVAAFINVGGVRASLESGDVTLGRLNEVQPFRNQLMIVELTGSELKAVLETPFLGTEPSGGLLIPSKGTRYSADMARASGDRVTEIVIGGSALDLGKKYKCTFLNFTANGGDAHLALKAAPGFRYDTGILDIDALVEYVKTKSPMKPTFEARVKTR